MLRPWRILLDPDPAPGGGGSPDPKPAPIPAPDLGKAAEGLVAKHGDPTAALLVLLGENYTLRDKVRESSGRLPPEGAVVLAGDQAKDWEHYRGLGRPADLRTALSERDAFRAEAGTFRRTETIRSAAKVTRIDGQEVDADVLAALAEKLDLVVDDLKDDKGVPIGEDGKPLPRDGSPVKTAFVKGEGDKLTPLGAYAKANWGKFLPSLKVAPAATRPVGTPAHNRAVATPARPVPGGGTGGRRVPTSNF